MRKSPFCFNSWQIPYKYRSSAHRDPLRWLLLRPFGSCLTRYSVQRAPLGEVKLSDWVDDDLFNVLPAICYFAYTLKTDLPKAEIVLIINTGIKEEIQDCFETAAKAFGVKFVRLHDVDKVNNHPSAKGMAAICDQIAEVLL